MTGTLDAALLDAHARHDVPALTRLYEEAASQTPDEDAAGFFLTHAYVFALEAGDPRAALLRDRLVIMGRDSPG